MTTDPPQRTVLVVDDEADIRALAQMSLEMVGGHRAVLAGSGAEALRLCSESAFDAVLMDVQMPVMDGPEVLRALREQDPQGPPVVFLTASVLAGDLVTLQDLPVAGVLSKPFDPMTLPAELGALLGWSG